MEEDRGSPTLMLSPSFREAEAEAEAEAEVEDAGESLTAVVDSPQKISAATEHHCEVEEDDDDDTSEDFEFAFVIKDPESSPTITADEIFSNGQIRSVYPVFNRDLLLADGGGDGGEAVEEKAVRMPLRRLLIEERNASSWSASASASSSSEMDELEGVDPGTYCVWRPGSVSPSPAQCKKSSSTGSSFRLRIRDLVRRSRSDGKEKFVFLAAEEKKPSRSSEKKKSEGAAAAAAKGEGEKKEKGEERRGGKEEGGVTEVDMVTAHRIYYRSRNGGGQTAKGGWRSFLPSKPDLVGFLANVNGLSPAHHPY